MEETRTNGGRAGRFADLRGPPVRDDELRRHIDIIRRAGLQSPAGRAAAERIIHANFGLVVRLARHYRGAGLPLADLVQAGAMGMLRALEDYDPERAEFSTYAWHWIRSWIADAVCTESRVVRLPHRLHDAAYRINRVETRFAVQHGRAPEKEELLALLYGPKEQEAGAAMLDEVRRTKAAYVWLDAPMRDADGDAGLETYHNVFPAPEEEDVEHRVDHGQLRALVGALPERHAEVLRLRFGLDGPEHTLEEVGARHGITRERVRQIETQALHLLWWQFQKKKRHTRRPLPAGTASFEAPASAPPQRRASRPSKDLPPAWVAVLGALPKREEQIVRMRSGIGCKRHSLREIGAVLNISHQRIQRLEKKAHQRLHALMMR